MRGSLVLVVAGVGLSACVTTKPYNPDNISAARLIEVSQICEQVMGLNPSDPLTRNLWSGDPDPGYETNDYRGCVTTLSNSLVDDVVAQRGRSADGGCRASGLKPGSPEFGVCVVNASEQRVEPLRAANGPVIPFSQASAPQPESSINEEDRRQQLACAEVGLEPGQSGFSRCMDGLRRALFAHLVNQSYTN
jgi:hypothetical protein